jgi:hypothetical protein
MDGPVNSDASKSITRIEMSPPVARCEPSLTVRPPPAPFFRRAQFWRSFAPFASLALAGLVVLLASANLLLPFERVVTLNGAMGSKAEFFNDERVRELLLRHHIQVQVTRMGSRDAANVNADSFDFVFPSGQPTAEPLIHKRRADTTYVHRPFVSPIVLATYRDYAETLRAAGVATPQDPRGGDDQPYYYSLDMQAFLGLAHDGKTWDDLKVRARSITSSNKVIAHITSMCTSNGAVTYLGLVSYVIHGKVPTSEPEAVNFANEIKPLLDQQGLSVESPEIYFIPEGRQIAPIVVMYEHQYLDHQLRHRERSGRLDSERVLLYPTPGIQTEPTFVGLNEDANRLGGLLTTDSGLRRLALELGFRPTDAPGAPPSKPLPEFLEERGMPVPSQAIETRAMLPAIPLLEKMISVVGSCPLAGPT